MKKFAISLLMLFIISYSTYAQSCLPNGIIFHSQDEIDNFQTNYPGCTEIEGDVNVGEWGSPTDITNLDGLSVITSIGGFLDFTDNPVLSSLSGLQNLTTIGGYLNFLWCDNLDNFIGLENLTTIGGDGLWIYENNDLTSLSGLENINAASIVDLWVCRNPSLSDCNIQPVCDYLVSPNGVVTIYDNADGCENPSVIANTCGFSMSCLPYGNYYFLSQSDIDNFQSNYSNCTKINGNLTIGGWGTNTNISNLNGLGEVDSIGGGVLIKNNPSLGSLHGLNKLTTIATELHIADNASLTSLTGLGDLTNIGDFLWLWNNDALEDISGLANLTSIGGDLWVTSNGILTSLIGLDNIDPNSITGTVYINLNDSLATCEVQSICEYLAIPGGNISINGNASGCNSQEEVEEACESVSVKEKNMEIHMSLFPNPAHQEFNISAEGYNINEVTIYTLTGQQVLHATPVIGTIDISAMQPGMYIVEVTIENSRLRQKLLVE